MSLYKDVPRKVSDHEAMQYDNLSFAVPTSYSNMQHENFSRICCSILWSHLTILTSRVCIAGERIETEESWEKIIYQTPRTNLKNTRDSLLVQPLPFCVVLISWESSEAGINLYRKCAHAHTCSGPQLPWQRTECWTARTDKLWVSKNKLLLDCYKYNDKISSSSPDPMFAIVLFRANLFFSWKRCYWRVYTITMTSWRTTRGYELTSTGNGNNYTFAVPYLVVCIQK